MSDGDEPPLTPRLHLSPTAHPRSLHRLVRQSKGHRFKNLRSDSFRKRCDNRPGHCARNVTEKPAKLTKRNPRRRREMAQPPNSPGGNGGNRGSIPSPFAPLPPVQTAQRRPVMPNDQLRHSRRSGRSPCNKVVRVSINGQLARSAAVACSGLFGNLLKPSTD